MTTSISPPVEPGDAFLRNCTALSVSGEGARVFLQGQCSQDVLSIDSHEARWSLLLEPDGKLGALVRIVCLGDDDFVVLADPARIDEVFARLSRFKLRVRAVIETVRVKIAISRNATSPAGGIPLPSFSTELVETLSEEVTSAASPEDHVDSAFEEFLNADLAIQDRDARAGMNPFELGSAVIEQAVSFTKGCYTGQELVARIDARGSSAPFRLVGAVVSGAGTFAADEPVMVAGEHVGSVLRGGTRGDHFEGIVRLARKVECPVDGIAGTADVFLRELGEQRPI